MGGDDTYTYNESLALISCTLILWGSIGTLAKASKAMWPEFFLWYEIGVLVAAAFLIRNVGYEEMWLSLSVAPWLSIVAACCSGTAVSVGTMCFLSAIDLVGVTLSYPVVMGMELTLGTALLYMAEPKAKLYFLVPACLCVLAAVALDALAQLQLTLDEEAVALADTSYSEAAESSPNVLPPEKKTERHHHTCLGKFDFGGVPPEDRQQNFFAAASDEATSLVSRSWSKSMDLTPEPEDDDGSMMSQMLRSHSTTVLAESHILDPHHRVAELAKKQEVVVKPPLTKMAIAGQRGFRRAVVAGCLLSVWPVLEAEAVAEGGMSVYAFLVVFSLAAAAAGVASLQIRARYVRRPASLSRERTATMPQAERQRRIVTAMLGVLAGVAWMLGVIFIFVSGEKLGVTVAISVGRCSPVVAATWGILVWGETEHARARAIFYLAAMFLCYCAGIVCFALSNK